MDGVASFARRAGANTGRKAGRRALVSGLRRIACKPLMQGPELQSNQYSGPPRPHDNAPTNERHALRNVREKPMNLRPFLLAMLWTIALAGTRPAMAANEYDEVTRLHHAGQATAALERADQFLATLPRDPQMRFLEAVILADTMRRAEAVAVLERLTEDYPDLAEPYNNLAALYAASGDYAKARAALDQALRLKPDYATAHENLGDVYAALAGQSYATALRLDPQRTSLAPKLALVRQLAAPKSTAPPATAASATPTTTR